MKTAQLTENIVVMFGIRPESPMDEFDFRIQFNHAKTGKVFMQSNGSLSDLIKRHPKEFWTYGVVNGVPQLDAARGISREELHQAIGLFCEMLQTAYKQFGEKSECLAQGQRYLDYLNE